MFPSTNLSAEKSFLPAATQKSKCLKLLCPHSYNFFFFSTFYEHPPSICGSNLGIKLPRTPRLYHPVKAGLSKFPFFVGNLVNLYFINLYHTHTCGRGGHDLNSGDDTFQMNNEQSLSPMMMTIIMMMKKTGFYHMMDISSQCASTLFTSAVWNELLPLVSQPMSSPWRPTRRWCIIGWAHFTFAFLHI